MSKYYFNNPATIEEFHASFCINRTTIFNVNYYTLGNNEFPYFTTSAFKFNKPKNDWKEGGQAQEHLCNGMALKFYKKWDKCHLKKMSDEEYLSMREDLEKLFKIYTCNILEVKEEGEDGIKRIGFYRLKNLSMKVNY